jgi:dTMP kinase
MNSGSFITLEGGEGVGKSTNLQFISQWLADRQIPVTLTREPGGTAIAEKIRSILLEKNQESLCEHAELLLIFAGRAQHIQHVIKPALERGDCVLCDRFTDATYAYQGGGRQLSMQLIADLEKTVHNDLKPNLTLLLDAPVEIGLERVKSRGKPDRFEIEQQIFFERVRQVYLQRAITFPERYRIINARLALEQVQQQISEALAEFFQQ